MPVERMEKIGRERERERERVARVIKEGVRTKDNGTDGDPERKKGGKKKLLQSNGNSKGIAMQWR